MEFDGTLSSLERHEQLLKFVERHQRVTVNQICEQFAISPATARRDLEVLSERGEIERFHGGAKAIRQAPPEAPVLQRAGEQAEEKKRIGQETAELISDGETVFLGSGTTVLEVARHLRDRRDLTVITNSLLVINALANVPSITVVGLGGVLRQSELSMIGHITEQALREVRMDKVILGMRAISLEAGMTNDYLPEVMTDRAIIQMAPELIVVADHTKFGKIASAYLASVQRIATLVTDSDTDAELLARLEAMGIRIIIASPYEEKNHG